MNNLVGFKELHGRLQSLAKKDQQKAMRRAVLAGIKPAVADAKAGAPEGATGRLRKAIYATRSRSNSVNGAVEAALLGVRKVTRTFADTASNRRTRRVGRKYKAEGSAFYWRFHEFGTRFHRRREFMQRSFARTQSKMFDAMRGSLRAWLDKLAR
jgi:HK97 gp10 family phage protein